ncbi:hypothetical protein BOTCAL_0045g00040 [Botryotinia calthae]|uniref:Uncharacterized protein n=1 Tax=Botryotinia calthae TaxID=38488 RepID=A0A4Y8DBY2_9HELO|nr:hypothetical protein BOTCAL_0045g00040 [Botryotinia calthae]
MEILRRVHQSNIVPTPKNRPCRTNFRNSYSPPTYRYLPIITNADALMRVKSQKVFQALQNCATLTDVLGAVKFEI